MENLTFKAVVWDMDGLLLDSERLSFIAWKQGADDIGEKIDESIFRELIGRNPKGIKTKLKELLGDKLEVEELTERAGIHYRELIKNGVPAKRGAKECLQLLTDLNIPQALATSSSLSYVENKLGHHKLLRHFETLVTGDQVQQGKPNPEPYRTAAKRLEVEPHSCIAFEDSVNGIKSAHDAGMKAILVPDLAIHDAESLSRVWKQFDSLTEALPLLKEVFEK